MIDNSQFDQSVQDLIGTKLSKPELTRLHEKYSKPGSDQLDRDRFLKDLKEQLVNLRENESVVKPKQRHVDGESFDSCMAAINGCIVSRLNQTQPNCDQALLKRAFHLFGASRTSRLSRFQLKQLCLNRLHLVLTEHNVDKIFGQLDPTATGSVKTRELLQTAIGVTESTNLFVNRNLPFEAKSDLVKVAKTAFVDNLTATMSYNHKFSDLTPPNSCEPMTLVEIEQQIGDKIFLKSGLSTNFIQSLVKCFGDSRLKGQKNVGISFDQMKYSLWKRLQLNVSIEDVEALFRKYDIHRTGFVPLNAFVEGIVKQHTLNEPLLVDPKISSGFTLASGTYSSSSLPAFMSFLRVKIQDRINREGRAPHYLLHGASRMTLNQTKTFFDKKLGVAVSDGLLQELLEHYPSSGLIDVKRVLRDAMAVSSVGVNGEDLALVDGGGIVVCSRMPSCLAGLTRSPDEIMQLLHTKMFQKSKDNHPLSSLHRLFEEDGVITRACGQAGLRRVFQTFDIILSEEDFQRFFAAHDRGDGKIDVRLLLVKLMHNQHSADMPPNGLVSKDVDELRREVLMTKSMANMTGIQRTVSTLQGPSYTTLNLDAALNSIEAQDQLLVKRPSSASGFSARPGNRPGSATAVSTKRPGSAARNMFSDSVTQMQQIFGDEMPESVSQPFSMRTPTREVPESNSRRKAEINESFLAAGQSGNESNQRNSEATRHSTQAPDLLDDADKPPVSALFSPIRPKSAPPSRSMAIQSPRLDAPNNTNAWNSSPRPATATKTSRPLKSTFVHTGQQRMTACDPLSPRLVLQYDLAKKHATKSHDNYGLFVKSYSRFAAERVNLEKKLRGR